MNYGASLLILGLLIIPVTVSYPNGSCNGYTNLTQPWRNKDFPTTFSPKDDSNLLNSWWRFTGIGGDTVITNCLSAYYGGTASPLYIPFTYPTSDSATPTSGNGYGIYFFCHDINIQVNVALCPGGFYIYQPLSHPIVAAGYVTYHNNCKSDSCGPYATCSSDGGCVCVPGMQIPYGYIPTADSYGCVDINECQSVLIACGYNSNCTNTIGSYFCTCLVGYAATSSTLPPSSSNPCTDINECLQNVCGSASCSNTDGSYLCVCNQGYYFNPVPTPGCQDIDECNTTQGICGPYSNCTNTIGSYTCTCLVGFSVFYPGFPPAQTNPCTDIDECQTTQGICGPYSNCINTIGSFTCTCLVGFTATNSTIPPVPTNPCIDIDECIKDVCGNGNCYNNPGSFVCDCIQGYYSVPGATPVCQDIDECNTTQGICGPYSNCINTIGSYTCTCLVGFSVLFPGFPPAQINPCTDIDECIKDVCGNGNCYNNPGSFVCDCIQGYYSVPGATPVCQDINECIEIYDICGKQAICNNEPGTFYCSCPDQLYPSTGVIWILGVTYCQSLQDAVKATVPPKGKTKSKAFLDQLDQELQNITGVILPEATVANLLSACMDVAGIDPLSGSVNVSSEGDAETGSVILDIAERLASAMISSPYTYTTIRLQTSTVDMNLVTIGPKDDNDSTIYLYSKNNTMEINLHATAKASGGFAAAAFMALDGLGSLLSHQYFKTQNQTEMYSDVLTALLLPQRDARLTKPVNFTIQHKKVPASGMVTCVYWDNKNNTMEGGQNNAMQWSTQGCWVTSSEENYTVCTCSHLSTFALIMQIGEPPPDNPFIDWLNRACVIIGLFFFALAILTFLLCSWNPKINNTARLHLCINSALSQLLLLWNDKYVDNQLACKVMAGLLHFLVVASFVWMLLEALQLHLLVRKLSKVQVIQRDGLPRPLLYLIGYGVPFVIVGVSALVFSDGYGATSAQACWLSTERNFNWALTGPVIVILAFNWTLFCATIWSLRPTLANMKSDVSQSKDTRLIVFKILAQFVILGCTWILGLYQTNLFFEVLFIILNSQQGTFLYIVHCLLNKEVREEYRKWLTCSFWKDSSVKDALSLSEDFKPEEKTDEGKKHHE